MSTSCTRPVITMPEMQDVNRTRVFVRNPDERVVVHHFQDPGLAYGFYLGLGKGVRAAYRAAGDDTAVYSWDLVDLE